MPSWTAEQILALAPDSGSAKAGKELASPRRWQKAGANERLAWGECQGSAKEPYQTQVDLTEPAFKCSCPSRKFPCKHALGLLLLLAAQPGLFAEKTPPAWVQEWQAKRAQAAEKPSRKKAADANPAPQAAASPAAPSAEAAKRAARRAERVRQGLADLDLWLSDLLRQGLSAAQAQPRSFWETPAARLVDAQAGGLARRVRELGALAGSGEGWQGRLLARAGDLRLLIAGYQRLEQLPPETQADIRAQIGWTQDQDELLQQAGVADRWVVLARRVEEETSGSPGRGPALRIQRTWLWGVTTRRPALMLDFAAPGQRFDAAFVPGACLEAELVFFAGGFPLRALLKKQVDRPGSLSRVPGFAALSEALQAYASALSANPWLELFPMLLNDVLPCQAEERWGALDGENRFLPFSPAFQGVWTLLALSGGAPIDIFCEWNGETLLPLSALAGGRLAPLEPGKESG